MARLTLAQIQWPEIIAGIVGGGGTAQAIHWWTSRKKVRADTFETVVNAMQKRLGATEVRLDQVEGQHEKCELELRGVNRRLDEATREIDRLMSGPVAGYKPRVPKGKV